MNACVSGSSDQQGWDKALFPLMEIFFIMWLIFISLDAVRFHWSSVPLWLQVIGALILLCSFYFLFLTFSENSYLSPVVRVQARAGTYRGFHRSLPLCTASDVHGNSCVHRGNVLVAWFLVWINFRDNLHDHTRKASGLGRTDAIERASRLCGLQGTGEISFHSISLVIIRNYFVTINHKKHYVCISNRFRSRLSQGYLRID